MHCVYEIIGSTPSAFNCDLDPSASFSAFFTSANHALVIMLVALGIICFFLAIQGILWWFKQ